MRELLAAVDNEFLPSLSSRSDTESTAIVAFSNGNGPAAYLNAMRRECWLIAFDGDAVVGLLSFRSGYEDTSLDAKSPSLHATTVAVAPGARRMGVARTMYDSFEQLARDRHVPYVTVRTWTTNTAHLLLLKARGWREVAHLPDDRDDGIGTVYLSYTQLLTDSHPA